MSGRNIIRSSAETVLIGNPVVGTHKHVDIIRYDLSMSFHPCSSPTVDGGNLAPLLQHKCLTLAYPLLNIGMESLHIQNCANDGNLSPPHTEQVSMLKRGAGMHCHAIEDACCVGGARFPPSTVWSDFNRTVIPRSGPAGPLANWQIEVWAQLCLVLSCYGGLTWAFRGLIQHIIYHIGYVKEGESW